MAGPVAMIRPLTSAASWKRWAAQTRSWVVAMTVLPAPRLRFEDVHQLLLGRRVDAGDRLVEQVELGFRGECPGQEHPPPLAAGQGPDLAVDLVVHADRPERGVDGVTVGPARPAGGCRSGRSDPSSRPRRRSPGTPSRRPPPAARRRPAGRRRRAVRRGPSTLPASGSSRPGDELEERALAGAVRPDDRQQRAGRDVEVDVVEGEPVAVAGGDTVAAGRPARSATRRGSAWIASGSSVWIIGASHRRGSLERRHDLVARSSASCRDTCRPVPARARRCRASVTTLRDAGLVRQRLGPASG